MRSADDFQFTRLVEVCCFEAGIEDGHAEPRDSISSLEMMFLVGSLSKSNHELPRFTAKHATNSKYVPEVAMRSLIETACEPDSGLN
jgi:hypothetical protein